MPLSHGMFAKNVLKASSPPAEAPIPTISGAGRGAGRLEATGLVVRLAGRADFVLLDLLDRFCPVSDRL
jgi:hypothetical protein